MRSPKDMWIIQIDITNACVHRCSNCTRFCGHHRKPFFMDFDAFKNAVHSLEDFTGIVGIIGGEPTLHPQFEKFCKYIREKRKVKNPRYFRLPPVNINETVKRMFHRDSRVGLWSSLCKSYYRHFETINDTFPTQLLNDHQNLVEHQALLMPRKELGISDEEWIKKRDACWIQNTWSASITPKGAFFCEVAAHLDMLFNGPGGWKVEPGWWRREPEDFKDQLHWCEMCSGCLDVPKRLSSDGRDDVTPAMLERLLALGSPKAKKGFCVVHNPDTFEKSLYKTYSSINEYMENAGNIRTSENNRDVYPKNFTFISPEKICGINSRQGIKDWILVGENEQELQRVQNCLADMVLNPGCIYFLDNDVFAFNIYAQSLREKLQSGAPLPQNLWSLYPADKIVRLYGADNNLQAEIKNLRYQLEHAQNAIGKIKRILPENSLRRKIAKKLYKFIT